MQGFFFFSPCAGRILVPLPGIKHVPPAVEANSLNHWTTREVCLDASLLRSPSLSRSYTCQVSTLEGEFLLLFSLGTSLSASWSQCQKSLGGPGFEVETFWLTSLKFASGSAKSICAHSRALFRGTYSTSQKSHGFPVLSHPP